MYTYTPFLLVLTPSTSFHPSRSSESTKLSSLCYTPGSYQLSFLHLVVYICQSKSPSSSHPTPPCFHQLLFVALLLLHPYILASVSCLLCFSPLLPTHCCLSILQYIWLFLLLSCKGFHIVLISVLERLLLV